MEIWDTGTNGMRIIQASSAGQGVHYLEVLENAAETGQTLRDDEGEDEEGQQSWGPAHRHPGQCKVRGPVMPCQVKIRSGSS